MTTWLQMSLFCRGWVLAGWEWSSSHLCNTAGWLPGWWTSAVQGGAEQWIQHLFGVLQVRHQVPGKLYCAAETTFKRWSHYIWMKLLPRGFKVITIVEKGKTRHGFVLRAYRQKRLKSIFLDSRSLFNLSKSAEFNDYQHPLTLPCSTLMSKVQRKYNIPFFAIYISGCVWRTEQL